MPMKMFDIGKAYSDAENIKGMRSRNQLAEQLGPLQVEGQQIQNRMGQMQLDQASQPKPVDPEDMARAVEWADTPEKWNTAIDTFVAEGNAGFEKYRDQFHRRDEFKALIAAETEKGKYGQPQAAIGPDGKPVFVRASPTGPGGEVMEGFTPVPKGSGEKGTYSYKSFVPEGATTAQIARTHSGKGTIEMKDESGNWVPAPKGSFVGQEVGVKSVGDLGPQKKEGVTLREQRDIMTNLVKAGNRLRSDLKVSGAKAIGWTGAIERFTDTTVAQGKALASRYNDGGMVDEIAKGIEWSPELASQSAAIKSQISSMAYSIALMKNGTRPTDEDVRHAMTMIGASGSPDQMLGAIDSLMRETVDNYSTRHKTITGDDWDAPEHFQTYKVPVPGSEQPATLEYIKTMEPPDLYEKLKTPGLSGEEIEAIDARLTELGY